MRYLSVCSGIEAATQAWHPLGWRAVAFSEIEAFPAAVLRHHYPDTPNWGDMTKFQEWPDAVVDVFVGGTPCQSFSVAGLRKGLADPRGNLALTYLAIADRYRPRWIVWENVPGVLSSNGGRDFGAFLGGLGQLGYGFAYRVLDAQFCRTRRFPRAVPQRRRRVFVVGYFGDWRRAAAVLFDGQSLRRDPAPRREAGERPAPTISARPTGSGGLGTDFDCDGKLILSHDPACTLTARERKGALPEADLSTVVAIQERAVSENPEAGPQGKGWKDDEAFTLEARNKVQAVAHALRGEGFKGSEDNTGRGTPLVPVAFDCKGTEVHVAADGSHPPLRSMGHHQSHQNAGGHAAVAFDLRGREGGAMPEGPHDTANMRAASGGSSRSYVAAPWAVRRLTPVECERLQGFPDDFTRIPYRNKPADLCPDGPRYKALGNSMAVNVMDWIGQRIAMVDKM